MNEAVRPVRTRVPSAVAVDDIERSGTATTCEEPQPRGTDALQLAERIAARSLPLAGLAGNTRAPGVASKPSRGAHPDESLQLPVVASQEEILLAEQLRLLIKKKYLDPQG